MLTRLFGSCLTVAVFTLRAADARDDEALAVATARAITAEALRPNGDPGGYALPLACSWVCGEYKSPLSAGWTPAHQMQLISEGHYLLPWFVHPPAKQQLARRDAYYAGAIARARALKLPITLVGSQWEKYLTDKPYIDLPPRDNPNVVTADGKILQKVSPFGPTKMWYDVGHTWTDSPAMQQLQEWYPDPPLIIFLSNNEHPKLGWADAEQDVRCAKAPEEDPHAEFRRKQIADGWIERYRALQRGLHDGLMNPTWRKHAMFFGYGAFGPPHFARWGNWGDYALPITGRIDSSPLMWDGGSPNYYTHDWDASTDYKVWSPQIESMNFLFMLEEALELNPRFWFEFSVWDGYDPSPERQKQHPSKRFLYRKAGQVYDPERYKGFVQFGMWLLRPRAVRDFRGYTEPWPDQVGPDGRVIAEGGGPYFMAIVDAVDRVHDDPVLREWWRNGTLVANRAHPHPYQVGVPPEYAEKDRWFLLDTSLDPPRPWTNETEIPVFALALVRGTKPHREWLIYAHAPTGERKGVRITIPDFEKAVMIDVPVGGEFNVISER
jgi:hypothetical protein